MKRVLVVSVLVLAGTYGIAAQAQEVGQPSYFEKGMVAPSKALELNVATAYNQGWGNLTDTVGPVGQTFGRQVQDVAGAGLALELDIGFRATPMLAAGIYGTIAGYTNQTDVSGTNFRSLTAGIQGQWYMRPFKAVCPWVTVGTGYRGSWLIPEVGGNFWLQGWEIARVQVGADLRLAKEFAIAPYIGGDINVTFSENLPNQTSRSLNGPPAFASFTAGVLGRFDFAGTYMARGEPSPFANDPCRHAWRADLGPKA